LRFQPSGLGADGLAADYIDRSVFVLKRSMPVLVPVRLSLAASKLEISADDRPR
jgi:hypothetical protein